MEKKCRKKILNTNSYKSNKNMITPHKKKEKGEAQFLENKMLKDEN